MTMTSSAAHHSDPTRPVPGGDKWVDSVLGSGYHHYRASGTWSPAVDVYESRDDFYVLADLAGVSADSVNIRMKGRTLTITGSRFAPQLPCQRMHVMEIDQGPFARTVEIPGEDDVGNVEAVFRSGLLWVRVPKRS